MRPMPGGLLGFVAPVRFAATVAIDLSTDR